MKVTIEQRRNDLCVGLVNLYAQEKELQVKLAQVQESIKCNVTAISEMEILLSEQQKVTE
jgi:hypothetical protein